MNRLQLGLLKEAAKQNWGNVEPAIFGTLLERALNPGERHQLGAHFTPRAYVERLVLPTVIEPLRAEWANVRAAAIAELVLWIGCLQWHFRLHGKHTPREPILRAFKNIECRYAVPPATQ